MNYLKLIRIKILFLAVFAAILFIRSFGLLGLFQQAPRVDGLSQDRHIAKKVHYFKGDQMPTVLPALTAELHFELVSRVLPFIVRLFCFEQDYSHSLRAPPVHLRVFV